MKNLTIIFVLISSYSYAQTLSKKRLKLNTAFIDTTNLTKWRNDSYYYQDTLIKVSECTFILKENEYEKYTFAISSEKINDSIKTPQDYMSFYNSKQGEPTFYTNVKTKKYRNSVFKNIQSKKIKYWMNIPKNVKSKDYSFVNKNFGIAEEYFLVHKNFGYIIDLSFSSPSRINTKKWHRKLKTINEIVNRLEFD